MRCQFCPCFDSELYTCVILNKETSELDNCKCKKELRKRRFSDRNDFCFYYDNGLELTIDPSVVTVCLVNIGPYLTRGVAIHNPSDAFDIKESRRKAYNRAIHAFYTKSNTGRIASSTVNPIAKKYQYKSTFGVEFPAFVDSFKDYHAIKSLIMNGNNEGKDICELSISDYLKETGKIYKRNYVSMFRSITAETLRRFANLEI